MKFNGVLRQEFSTAEAARLAGLTPRQLDYWDRLGFLKPSRTRASGYGSARRYSFTDVLRLRVAARLRASGIGLARVRRCVAALARLENEGEGDLARARLIVVGRRVLWARSEREVVDLLKEGQLVLVFSLGGAVEEAAGAVAKLAREAEGRDDAPPRGVRRAKPSS